MTREDADQLDQLARDLPEIGRIGILSPGPPELKIFPKATAIPRWRWNLDKPNARRFDLIVAANVFMYSSDPPLWFRHVLASCRYFLLLDLVRRKRSREGELGPDRDRMRYALGRHRPRIEHGFDLGQLDDRILGYRTYHGGANEFDEEPLHFVALFRGDLAEPLLRIDDYPTGIRPILDDLSPLHQILTKVESHGLRYYLGIVPALVDDDMGRFLRGLEHALPAVHGYDHAYFKYAPILQAKGDPFNQGTVGSFNEFKGEPYDVIVERLRRGRRLLEDRLGTAVDTYIPPGNLGDRRTGQALIEAGYRHYLSERRIAGCSLPWMKSDFYGKSDGYDPARPYHLVTLHLTWEWDLVRQGTLHSLDRLLGHLAGRCRAEREIGLELAALMGSVAESITGDSG